jgi:hypothetical protein
VADASGRLVAQRPAHGPCQRTESACRLVRDHERPRKTGPCFGVLVLRCQVHKLGFTLYPPGHVPYGRQALITLAPDGGRIHGRPSAGRASFVGTLLSAVVAAAAGEAWGRSEQGGEAPWWGTQVRAIERAQQLVGVAPTLHADTRTRLAEALDVDGLLLRPLARSDVPEGYRSRGERVCRVLDVLSGGLLGARRLHEAGAISALWGPALHCNAQGEALRAFRGHRTRAAPS